MLECLDTALLSEGILHYLAHLRGTFTAEHAAIIPAAGVVKGMLVEMRTGDVHGIDMTMSDAYRWSKEARPVHLENLEEGSYVQLTVRLHYIYLLIYIYTYIYILIVPLVKGGEARASGEFG